LSYSCSQTKNRPCVVQSPQLPPQPSGPHSFCPHRRTQGFAAAEALVSVVGSLGAIGGAEAIAEAGAAMGSEATGDTDASGFAAGCARCVHALIAKRSQPARTKANVPRARRNAEDPRTRRFRARGG
jgi:hypothetical protein